MGSLELMEGCRALGLGVLIVALGCATGGGGRIPAESLGPCEVNAPKEHDWRQVASEEISFCVSADWTSMGRNGWRGSGGSVTWGSGAPERRIETATMVVSSDDMPPMPPRPIQPQRFAEVIGGVPVELWLIERQGEFLTGATWNSPRSMYMTGEAIFRGNADLQFEIFRTARIIGD